MILGGAGDSILVGRTCAGDNKDGGDKEVLDTHGPFNSNASSTGSSGFATHDGLAMLF